MDMIKRNMNAGLVAFGVKFCPRGYTRSIAGLYRFLKKQGQMDVKSLNPTFVL